ncbi:MAG: hypothetical protein PWP49_142 [Thermococcaceae archaeon]|uniref:hypothetical protein n=1 Tax=Thermococcus sp. PK TaxID=913025 RepID=UPI0005B252EC|nr:hypothetical protein [Thermococcus sp. PK]MDK2853192.1 hypothetical protein [Thermococcaceae archaeon]MDN5319722.1 hypothetical protein [Thermococcaceae archaeon]HIH73363.1 hypothetical protein [Thermococcaceae archaeon]
MKRITIDMVKNDEFGEGYVYGVEYTEYEEDGVEIVKYNVYGKYLMVDVEDWILELFEGENWEKVKQIMLDFDIVPTDLKVDKENRKVMFNFMMSGEMITFGAGVDIRSREWWNDVIGMKLEDIWMTVLSEFGLWDKMKEGDKE